MEHLQQERLAVIEEALVTLVVGDLDRWAAMGKDMPEVAGMVFTDATSLTARLLDSVAPDIVLSPLTLRTTDAVEIARRLHGFGFTGRYRVVAGEVPNAGMIREEVALVAPDLDFSIFSLKPGLKSV